MIVVELLEAVIMLGLPVFCVSWWAVRRLYKKGDIRAGADRRAVKSDLKAFRNNWRKDKEGRNDFMENKWMRFGGGFYGITALTTFLVIELGEIIGFLGNLSMLGSLFSDGVIALLVDILVGQVQNFFSALIWFAYWADGDRSVIIWFGIAYASYLLGINVALKSGIKDVDSGGNPLVEDEAGPVHDHPEDPG